MPTIEQARLLRDTISADILKTRHAAEQLDADYTSKKTELLQSVENEKEKVLLLENLIIIKRIIRDEEINNYSNLIEKVGQLLSEKISNRDITDSNKLIEIMNNYLTRFNLGEQSVLAFLNDDSFKFTIENADAIRAIGMITSKNSGYGLPFYLRDDGKMFHRPATVKETALRKLEDFYTYKDDDGNVRTLDNRLRLWKNTLSTITGMHSDGNYVRVIPLSEELINSPVDNGEFTNTSFGDVIGNIISLKKVYVQTIKDGESAVNNSIFSAIFEDMIILKEYERIVKKNFGPMQLIVPKERFETILPVNMFGQHISVSQLEKKATFIAPYLNNT